MELVIHLLLVYIIVQNMLFKIVYIIIQNCCYDLIYF